MVRQIFPRDNVYFLIEWHVTTATSGFWTASTRWSTLHTSSCPNFPMPPTAHHPSKATPPRQQLRQQPSMRSLPTRLRPSNQRLPVQVGVCNVWRCWLMYRLKTWQGTANSLINHIHLVLLCSLPAPCNQVCVYHQPIDALRDPVASEIMIFYDCYI
jgi:hypothetical protein